MQLMLVPVDYSSMVKQRSLGPDNMDDGDDASSPFLDALRTRAMDDMLHAALEYGIVLKDLGTCDLFTFYKAILTGAFCSRHRPTVQG